MSFYACFSSPGASRGSLSERVHGDGGAAAAHQRSLTGEGQGLLPQTPVPHTPSPPRTLQDDFEPPETSFIFINVTTPTVKRNHTLAQTLRTKQLINY